MELQDQVLRFPLTNILSRQIFEYQINGWNVLMMYDSGAQIPVWCRSEGLFCRVFPDAKKTDFHCDISGFGRETERSNVYIIPLFELIRKDASFQIKNLLVATLFKPFIGCDLLLRACSVSQISLVFMGFYKNSWKSNFFPPSTRRIFGFQKDAEQALSETMFSKTDTLTVRRGKRELCVSYTKMNRPFICSAMSQNKEAMGISVWTEDV